MLTDLSKRELRDRITQKLVETVKLTTIALFGGRDFIAVTGECIPQSFALNEAVRIEGLFDFLSPFNSLQFAIECLGFTLTVFTNFYVPAFAG